MNGFTIYKEYWDLITLLSEKEQNNILRAIIEYMFEDKEPNLTDRENKVFSNLKRPLDKSKIKSKNGSKQNQNEIKTKSKQNQNEIKKKTQQVVNVIVNDNVNVNIYEYIENEYNRTLTSTEILKIDEWLLWFSEDIIKYAFEISIMQNKRTFSYVTGILNNWKSNNYKTLAEIKTKKENLPSWFNKEIKKEELLNEQELRELEQIENGTYGK